MFQANICETMAHLKSQHHGDIDDNFSNSNDSGSDNGYDDKRVLKYAEDEDMEVLVLRSCDNSNQYDVLKSYKRRWYILALWCAAGFANFEIWNTWGPIQNTAKYVFDWETSEISLLVNLGLITLIIFPPVFVYVIEKFGLRCAVLITVFCITSGSAIRLILVDGVWNNLIQDLGEFLNGIGGVMPMAGSTMLSLKWLVHLIIWFDHPLRLNT